MEQTKIHNIIALDVGDVRVGIARANTIARLAQPFITLRRGESFWDDLVKLLVEEKADEVIIGLPRNLDGDDTPQTKTVRKFVTDLQAFTALPIHFQDEALTTKKAKEELESRKRPYSKEAVDALAASYILDDYLQEKL